MVEVAVPFIEPVNRGEKFIAITKVVLSKLSGDITDRLEKLGQRRIFLLNSALGTGYANGCHARTDRHLPRDEGRSTRGATWLSVVIRKDGASPGNAVDIRGTAHHAVGIGADIPHANVITKDHENVGLFLSRNVRLCLLPLHTTSPSQQPKGH